MIEDKKLGVKFAENEEEAAWYNFAEGYKQNIKFLKGKIERAKKDLKKSAREIEQKFKNGAKASIKADKKSIIIQKEILEFANSKLETFK